MGRLKPLGFREIKRRLESVGFQEVSQKGSHVKFARVALQRTDTVIVPRHNEVPVGTPRSILNQAHIDPDSWDKTLIPRQVLKIQVEWPSTRFVLHANA